MNAYLLPIILQFIGIIVIITEIFIPSLGLLSVMALGVFAYSLYLVFTDISTTMGMIFLGADVILVPIFIIWGMKILAKSPLALKQKLSKKDGIMSQNTRLETYMGAKGKAVTDLRPAGMAQIKENRVDVVTDGEYIDSGTPIIVTGVTGNQIVVGKIIKRRLF